MLDFNRENLAAAPISVAINTAIEHSRPPEINTRQYLGASSIGSPCLRRVQYDWMCDPANEGQTQDIFARGHLFEDVVRGHMVRAGFEFAPAETLGFSTFGGVFRPRLPECVGTQGSRRRGLARPRP
jgi:hypothetical protein